MPEFRRALLMRRLIYRCDEGIFLVQEGQRVAVEPLFAFEDRDVSAPW
jgi:hypothetical protein